MDETGAAEVQPGGAEGLTSELLSGAGFAHAFFTRRGGVSAAPWDSLNFAVSTGDSAEHVRENRARAAAHLGVLPGALHYLSQVHGVAHRVLDTSDQPEVVVREVGDITVSATPRVACGVRTADCVPVLVGDRRTGAVTAIHSGWRGTVADAVGAGIASLRTLVGAGELVAAVGPHIERCCFEVDEDVAALLAGASSAGRSAVIAGPGREKPRVDLRAVVRAQLAAAGVPGDAVDDVAGCTVCDRRRFFSFRRDGARSGRLLSAIVAR